MLAATRDMLSPAQYAIVARCIARLESAGHGAKGRIKAEFAGKAGVTEATFARWIGEQRCAIRKRRTDAGMYGISRAHCEKILSMMIEGMSENAKQRMTRTDAIRILRANGEIPRETVDPETGEIHPPLTDSAIGRAMRAYGLTVEIATAPTPSVRLQSLHPNHVWQVDASVCVLYWLQAGNDSGHGLMPLKKYQHYKNKPENLRAIEKLRVIRYVCADHASGVIRVRYYPHAECGEHVVAFLAWCMARKHRPDDPFHGAPSVLMCDGGTGSEMVRRFCKTLDIRLIVNKPHNPRAKGQVEQANNLWETRFESGLLYTRDRVSDFASLNDLAYDFQLWLNATQKHTRSTSLASAATALLGAASALSTAAGALSASAAASGTSDALSAAGSAAGAAAAAAGGGSIHGFSPHDRADNLLVRMTAGEFVTRRKIMRQPGALPFMTAFNAHGMRAVEAVARRMRLPGYADGGLVLPAPTPAINTSALTRNWQPAIVAQAGHTTVENKQTFNLIDDPARISDALKGRAGIEAITVVLSRDPAKFRSILGG